MEPPSPCFPTIQDWPADSRTRLLFRLEKPQEFPHRHAVPWASHANDPCAARQPIRSARPTCGPIQPPASLPPRNLLQFQDTGTCQSFTGYRRPIACCSVSSSQIRPTPPGCGRLRHPESHQDWSTVESPSNQRACPFPAHAAAYLQNLSGKPRRKESVGFQIGYRSYP